MGSRRAGNFRTFLGSRSAASRIFRVQSALRQHKSASIVVNTAVGLLALSNPTVATLVAAYHTSKFAYGVASKAKAEYSKTGSPKAAANAAAGEVVNSVRDMGRGEAISTTVDVGWGTIKTATGIRTTPDQDKILTTAAKSTLDEVLPK
jgi:hypothetical protein